MSRWRRRRGRGRRSGSTSHACLCLAGGHPRTAPSTRWSLPHEAADCRSQRLRCHWLYFERNDCRECRIEVGFLLPLRRERQNGKPLPRHPDTASPPLYEEPAFTAIVVLSWRSALVQTRRISSPSSTPSCSAGLPYRDPTEGFSEHPLLTRRSTISRRRSSPRRFTEYHDKLTTFSAVGVETGFGAATSPARETRSAFPVPACRATGFAHSVLRR